MDDVDPSRIQSGHDIEAFLGRAKIGMEVAIRHETGGKLTFVLTRIEDINTRRGRLYTAEMSRDGGRAWSLKTGTNCVEPRGPSRLVVPTLQVRDFISRCPQGVAFEPARPAHPDVQPALRRKRRRT